MDVEKLLIKNCVILLLETIYINSENQSLALYVVDKLTSGQFSYESIIGQVNKLRGFNSENHRNVLIVLDDLNYLRRMK